MQQIHCHMRHFARNDIPRIAQGYGEPQVRLPSGAAIVAPAVWLVDRAYQIAVLENIVFVYEREQRRVITLRGA
ncbi:hypothetical protein HYQ45_016322 [Verticillium longisporum]|uniref:Uncharacterized protein n=1 Tax=Verticillium longisporum TaxID=100787 RepID=A0A8I3AJU7_VERLO|nr:hypothetical protein HYQ45_016322 [Verticillium longisporum]